MSVLAAPISLGTKETGIIEDVEALVRKVVDDRLRKWGARLKELDHDDLVSYLIGVCWELSRRYDPSKDRNPNLGSYAAHILSLRVADWYRQQFGDTRHGPKPVVLSLDAPAGTGSGDDGAEGRSDRLVDTLAASTGDPAVDRSPDLVGVLQRGNRRPDRREDRAAAHDTVGQPAARRATARAAGATAVKRPRVRGTKRVAVRPPVCESCFKKFVKVFKAVNKQTPEHLRLSDDDVTKKAAVRAQAVKFGTEWVCPRCVKLETPMGKKILLGIAYPNRESRRKAVTASKRRNDGKRKGL